MIARGWLVERAGSPLAWFALEAEARAYAAQHDALVRAMDAQIARRQEALAAQESS